MKRSPKGFFSILNNISVVFVVVVHIFSRTKRKGTLVEDISPHWARWGHDLLVVIVGDSRAS